MRLTINPFLSDEAVQPAGLPKEPSAQTENEIRNQVWKGKRDAAGHPAFDALPGLGKSIDLRLQWIENFRQPHSAIAYRFLVFVEQISFLAPVEVMKGMAVQKSGQVFLV